MTYIVYYSVFGKFVTESFTPTQFECAFGDGSLLTRPNEGWMIV